MAQGTRTLRVFADSMFTGLAEEPDAVQHNFLPELQAPCRAVRGTPSPTCGEEAKTRRPS